MFFSLMPQLDIFTIFYQVIQFFFVFWILYFYLLKYILPSLYKSIKVRNNKINSLTNLINVKMYFLVSFKKLELFKVFSFYNAVSIKIYSNILNLLKLFNLKVFNIFYLFFNINYKINEHYCNKNLYFLVNNSLKNNNLKIFLSKKLLIS